MNNVQSLPKEMSGQSLPLLKESNLIQQPYPSLNFSILDTLKLA